MTVAWLILGLGLAAFGSGALFYAGAALAAAALSPRKKISYAYPLLPGHLARVRSPLDETRELPRYRPGIVPGDPYEVRAAARAYPAAVLPSVRATPTGHLVEVTR